MTFEQIQQLHFSGELNQAKKGYLRLLKKNPKDLTLLHALGILCAQEEQWDEAIGYFKSALDLAPHHCAIYLNLANVYKALHDYDQAIHILHECLALDSDYAPAYNNLGTLYFIAEKWPQAIKHFKSALSKNPDYLDAYYNLALSYIRTQQTNDAIATLKTLIDKSPEHGASQFQLARLLLEKQDYLAAEKILLHLEQAHPFHFETQTNLATCYVKLGALTLAKEHYLKALELDPHDPQVLFNLGVLCTELGLIDEAIPFYQRLLIQDPQHFAAQNNLANTFLMKRHIPFALAHFHKALQLDPQNKAIEYTISALSEAPHLTSSPPEYIQNLFDAYADHYEPHLLYNLDYKVPTLLLAALKKVCSPPLQAWDIMDLGCGTGLCGPYFQPFAKSLVGVDLSPKMLELARQKDCYSKLITADITPFLKEQIQAFDLILAADVLVYKGDLSTLISYVYQALKPGGFALFNTEMTEKKDFVMNQSGRFAHHKNYLAALATQHHFLQTYYEQTTTRQQQNEPVLGHIVVWQRQ